MGFVPRLAPENSDNAVNRLDRIETIVAGAKYGIHDLSRCRAVEAGEFARMNMPFELGIDYACRQFGDRQQRTKAILVLEDQRRDYLAALSDISGWDIRSHEGDHIKAARRVRDWLLDKPNARQIGTDRILLMYATFLEWFVEREADNGASLEDINEYPIHITISAMLEWSEKFLAD